MKEIAFIKLLKRPKDSLTAQFNYLYTLALALSLKFLQLFPDEDVRRYEIYKKKYFLQPTQTH